MSKGLGVDNDRRDGPRAMIASTMSQGTLAKSVADVPDYLNEMDTVRYG